MSPVRGLHACLLAAGRSIVCAAVLLCGPVRAEPVDPGRLLDAVVEGVERNFYDERKLQQLGWRERAQTLRPDIAAARIGDAVRRINELLATLETSHTGLFTTDDYFYYALLDFVGVAPDHRVERPLPYAGGADPVLDAAVELLAARQ